MPSALEHFSQARQSCCTERAISSAAPGKPLERLEKAFYFPEKGSLPRPFTGSRVERKWFSSNTFQRICLPRSNTWLERPPSATVALPDRARGARQAGADELYFLKTLRLMNPCRVTSRAFSLFDTTLRCAPIHQPAASPG
ncbi:hypothetical protein ebA1684 [Aromatoleum aromaticum EbN1]|uniref:Uncharacterized protein n=1 Tax=Aromatoleum aromaticum (strain DSM 19018 / LMG 30748 / EbN1) TaxID=76114 RepID=Q5P6M6_AROAE|nr:hypothetical protein ebA1684 [Aromatoleum aromaticum EbN1]